MGAFRDRCLETVSRALDQCPVPDELRIMIEQEVSLEALVEEIGDRYKESDFNSSF
jgi:hypothetical protein